MAPYSLLRHSISHISGTGISTCCPSATPFGLVLGPDSPWVDELYPGTLRQTVEGILTLLALLTPAFSLLIGPALLTVYLHSNKNAPLPLHINYEIHSFGFMFSPGTFSAQCHSTSELLRTL